jgi:hypothetical protein
LCTSLQRSGIAHDVLQHAARDLAPKLKYARLVVEAAKAEVSTRRAKLKIKSVDPTNAALMTRKLWKLDKFNAMPDADRNRLMADFATLDPELRAVILEMPGYANIHQSDLSPMLRFARDCCPTVSWLGRACTAPSRARRWQRRWPTRQHQFRAAAVRIKPAARVSSSPPSCATWKPPSRPPMMW